MQEVTRASNFVVTWITKLRSVIVLVDSWLVELNNSSIPEKDREILEELKTYLTEKRFLLEEVIGQMLVVAAPSIKEEVEKDTRFLEGYVNAVNRRVREEKEYLATKHAKEEAPVGPTPPVMKVSDKPLGSAHSD